MLTAQLLRDPRVLFAGYKVPHPLENSFVLKIQVRDGERTRTRDTSTMHARTHTRTRTHTHTHIHTHTHTHNAVSSKDSKPRACSVVHLPSLTCALHHVCSHSARPGCTPAQALETAIQDCTNTIASIQESFQEEVHRVKREEGAVGVQGYGDYNAV
jgi:DNA-directed RNA polymerase subunit L